MGIECRKVIFIEECRHIDICEFVFSDIHQPKPRVMSSQ